MLHSFNLNTLNGAGMQLRVKAPTRQNPHSLFQLHMNHTELPPIARPADRPLSTAVFTCIDYRESTAMHYTAVDWLERFCVYYLDTDDEDTLADDRDGAFARIRAENDAARQYNTRLLAGRVAPAGVLCDPSRGAFAHLQDHGDDTRFRVQTLTMHRDDTEGATAVTTACPLRITLALLFERDVRDCEGADIGGVRVSSVRLDFRSV